MPVASGATLCGMVTRLLVAGLWLLAPAATPADEVVQCMRVSSRPVDAKPGRGIGEIYDFTVENQCDKDVVAFTIAVRRPFDGEMYTTDAWPLDLALRGNDLSQLDFDAPEPGEVFKTGSRSEYRRNPVHPLGEHDSAAITAAVFVDGSTSGQLPDVQFLARQRCSVLDGFLRIQGDLEATRDFDQAKYYWNQTALQADNTNRSPSVVVARGFHAATRRFLKTADAAAWAAYHDEKMQWVSSHIASIREVKKKFGYND